MVMSLSAVSAAQINEQYRIHNLPVHRHGYRIKDLLNDYWDDFIDENFFLPIRPVVFKSVENVRNCATGFFGYSFYECPDCGNFYIVNHTCKDRFCNSCGIQYAKRRSTSIASLCVDCTHRHIVFTIPDKLRSFFRKDRRRLSLLFEAANTVIKWVFQKHGKSMFYTPGFVSVCHTFGRDLKWNPHIHTLITEGMFDRFGHFKPMKFFPYETLRKSFQKTLLDLVHLAEGPSFYKTKCELYTQNKDGFYVYAKEGNFDSVKACVDYVVRYAGRPAMAESRILNVNYETDEITYFYEPHEDDALKDEDKTGPVQVTEHVYEFFKKIILHIPEPQFKMIRYYGVYSSRRRRYALHARRLFRQNQIRALQRLARWRASVFHSFCYDPVLCGCGAVMVLNRAASHYP